MGNSTATSASDEARRMEDLRHELHAKEDELRAREGALRERMVDLEKMVGRAAEADADQMHEDAVRSVADVKVKSGIRRMDDLLYGGFPAGAQLLLNGPAHTGKDVLARLFSTEGLRLGIPSIWVVTDKTWGQVREDLAGLYPKYEDAERAGMIRFVDLYSRSVGSTQSTSGVRLLSSTDKGVLDQLSQTVNAISEELKEKFPTYRLVFESVSTVTAYLDTTATFRFLQPFIGRRKIDGAVVVLRPRPRHALGRRPRDARAHGRRVGQPEDRAAEDVPLREGDRRDPVARVDRLHVHEALAQPGLVQPRPHPLDRSTRAGGFVTHRSGRSSRDGARVPDSTGGPKGYVEDPASVRPLGWTGGLGVPLHTETVLSGGDRQERRSDEQRVSRGFVDAPFRWAAGIATSARRSALAVIHHGHRVRS